VIIFTPKSEEELSQLLPDGYYRMIVVEEKESISKAGNPKLTLKLSTTFNERDRFVYIDLMFHAMEHIPRHFFDSCGKIDIYESGRLKGGECINQVVYANVIRKHHYQDSSRLVNEIKDFVTFREFERIKENQKLSGNGKSISADEFKDDELPF
jgi:hypothetical protein